MVSFPLYKAVAAVFLWYLANGATIAPDGHHKRRGIDLVPRQTFEVGVNATLNQPPPKAAIVSWVAFGDSFSAGPGAGAKYNNDDTPCMRREGSYAPQLMRSNLFFSGYHNPQLNFLSCTGDITTQVESNQIPSVQKSLPFMGLATLSIGGNDVGFASILVACVFNPAGFCTRAIADARTTMYGGTLYNNYFSMINLMINSLNWCPPSGTGRTRAYDCFTLLYQTAYPSFFESYTTQCNNARFLPIVGPSITQQLRSNLNQLGQELNTLLAYYIANINQQQRGNRDTWSDFMVFADQGERFAGHRFCSNGVTEPDVNNPDTWFFNYGSKADSATVVFGGNVSLGPASDYTATNPNSCTATDDMEAQLNCAISQMVSSKLLSGGDQVIDYTASEDKTKTFHPNTNGFGAVSAEVQQRLGYISAVTEGRGCPTASNLNLRIVGIGDEITLGYQSVEGGGYFTSLDENLGVSFPGCPANQFSFIGSQTSGGFHSEGYSGLTVAQIHSRVQASGILTKRPNLILLMAGTIDINQGADPLTTVATLSTFIDYLFAQCPDAVILVQHIPPIGYEDFGPAMSAAMQNVIKFNAGISAMVDTRIAQGQHISRVHGTTTTFDRDDGDKLHPNEKGYSLIGDAWTERITVVDQLGWLESPMVASTTYAGPTTFSTVTSASASLYCTDPSLEDGDGLCTCNQGTVTTTITPKGGPGNSCPTTISAIAALPPSSLPKTSTVTYVATTSPTSLRTTAVIASVTAAPSLYCSNPSLEDSDGLCTCNQGTVTTTITPKGGLGNTCPTAV